MGQLKTEACESLEKPLKSNFCARRVQAKIRTQEPFCRKGPPLTSLLRACPEPSRLMHDAQVQAWGGSWSQLLATHTHYLADA